MAAERAGAAVGDDHVLRLDVAVDHPAVVCVLERADERQAHAQHVAVGEVALLREPVEGAAADELGDEVAGLGVLAASKTATIPGWSSRAAARASRDARSGAGAPAGMTLTATTSRSSRSSTAA